jgi:hypothetical protein
MRTRPLLYNEPQRCRAHAGARVLTIEQVFGTVRTEGGLGDEARRGS